MGKSNILCQAGKGRSPMMSHNKAYAAGYENINWHRKKKKLTKLENFDRQVISTLSMPALPEYLNDSI
jgi:hypothetical protein